MSTMKTSFFWGVTPCSLVGTCPYFTVTVCLHLLEVPVHFQYTSVLLMGEARSSEMSYVSARPHGVTVPEDSSLHCHRYYKLKSQDS